MSSLQNNIVIKMAFTDESTRTYTLTDVDSSALTAARSTAKAINSGTAENVADFRKTFVSQSGASFASIQSVKYVTITEADIYNVNS